MVAASLDVNLFGILVHVLAETSRHAGHADILREELDGAVGTDAESMALQLHDSAFWDGAAREGRAGRPGRRSAQARRLSWSRRTGSCSLDEHAPGLAPRPLARETDPPVVVMSRVAGDPLDTVLTPALRDGDGRGLPHALRGAGAAGHPAAPLRTPEPSSATTSSGSMRSARRTDLPDVVRRALAAARRWHADPPLGIDEIRDPVMAQGDGKVDNMLWDGDRSA